MERTSPHLAGAFAFAIGPVPAQRRVAGDKTDGAGASKAGGGGDKNKAAANLAVLRGTPLDLVRADPSGGSLEAKRERAAWDASSM